MDYVVGSVAALISGNVTPNRPKLVRRALTPTKHQLSPNVTPKSEFVEGRSKFLSPTQQKKKAIVKKSPKRIFQNPDLDTTEDGEGNSLVTPKAEKVKKHLKDELDADDVGKQTPTKSKPPGNKLDKSSDEVSLKKKSKVADKSQASDGTPKKKKRSSSEFIVSDDVDDNTDRSKLQIENPNITESKITTVNKMYSKSITDINADNTKATHTQSPKKRKKIISNTNNQEDNITQVTNHESKKSKKNKKKNKKLQNIDQNTLVENKENTHAEELQNPGDTQCVGKKKNPNKSKKNRKNKSKQAHQESVKDKSQDTVEMDVDNQSESDSEEVKSKNIPNPNAITEKDSDSEHDSDNEIESENEQENEEILAKEDHPEASSDEEEPVSSIKKKENKEDKEVAMTDEEIKRTLFVGNVPFSSKCKKEIKKIFAKYGQIETIRIRTIPVKDARVTPKLAIIKNELHPERTTVNVYVKFADATSVSQALTENNTVLNGHHLRVSRSDSRGAEHDARCAVFVGNLPFAIEDDTLRTKFENCGEISSVRIIRDRKTNAGKGFGYVNFASKDGVELALAMSEEDLTIKNRILRVKRCSQQKGGGKGGNQVQGGKWGNQAPRQGGNQGQGGGRWQNQAPRQGGNQGQGGGRWQNQAPRQGGNQGQGGGKWGNQGPRQGDHQGPRQGGHQAPRQGFSQGPRHGGNQGQSGGRWGNQVQRQGGNQGQGGRGNWGGQGQGGKWGQGQEAEGAARRMMNKRKQPEAHDSPPNKKQKPVNQPTKEKKPRKEFVGMTAEKKKKHKFDKGLKKKKALSEILTKKS